MRAFMSDRAARVQAEADSITMGDLVLGRDARVSRYGAMAEREAEAILAETEPTIMSEYATPYTQSDMRLTVTTRDYHGYAVAVACLADALRAFVEED